MTTATIPSFAELLADVLGVRDTLRDQLLGLAEDEVRLNASVPGRALVTTRRLLGRRIHIERQSWSIWRHGSMMRVTALTYCHEIIKSARATTWTLDGHECGQCFRAYREAGYQIQRLPVDF